MSKPSIPKGTRDFLPAQVVRRNYIFSIVENVFSTFGYLPIETPAMESLQTLTGKYGEEGDRLLFKVLNNGDFLAEVPDNILGNKDSLKIIPSISKRGLRYDLTVPFARFVVMHQNEINLPFKRYQIQQVWRADRPQKGRYQEFYQCDVDVVGSDSLMYEAELVQIYATVFRKLGLKVQILINNRKVLFGLAEAAGIPDKFMAMTIAIDKLDKIGPEGVRKEMTERNIRSEQADKILQLLESRTIDSLANEFIPESEGAKGIAEINTVMNFLEHTVPELTFDISLARGLNYYTGCIFEVKADPASYPSLSMGSLGGGGRYDDLTGVFGLKGVSGVGVSFGAERIYDVMEELSLFPEMLDTDIVILLIALDEKSHLQAFRMAGLLRQKGIASDVYPEPAKMKKQLSYANDRNVPFVGILGEEELNKQTISLRNMKSGEQITISWDDISTTLSRELSK